MNAISRPRRYGAWILLALLVGGGAWYWSKRPRPEDAIKLETSEVVRGDLVESISSTGQLSALEEVNVGSQVSGTITDVLVDFNSPVKKGELMAVVDPKTLQAQVTSAKAALFRTQTAYDEAVTQLEEGKPLHRQGYLSDKDLRTLEVAVQAAKSQLTAAQSDYDRNNVQLQYAEIRSPIDGIVMTRSVDPGNTVQSNMTIATLFVVASDLARMKILATVDETQIATIKEGMKATFTVSGIADKTFDATVRQVRLKSTTTNNVVTYTVVLDAENPQRVLFPGMTATIDFILDKLEGRLLVPSSALRMRVPELLRVEDEKPKAPDAPGGGANAAGAAGNRAGGGMQRRPGRMDGPGGGKQIGIVWMLNAEGKAYRVPVRILGSDLTHSAVEPLRGDLQQGDSIVTRVVDPTADEEAARSGNSNQNRMMGPGMMAFPGGGGGGGGRNTR